MAGTSNDEKEVNEAIDKFYQEADKVKEEISSIEERRDKTLQRFNAVKDRFLKVRTSIESSNSEDKLTSLMDIAPIEDRIGIVEWYHIPNLTLPMIYSSTKNMLIASIEEVEERLDEIEKQFSVVLERMEEKYGLIEKREEEKKEEKEPEQPQVQPGEIQHELNHMIPNDYQQPQPQPQPKPEDLQHELNHMIPENQQKEEQRKMIRVAVKHNISEHCENTMQNTLYSKPNDPAPDLYFFMIQNIDLGQLTSEEVLEFTDLFQELSRETSSLTEQERNEKIVQFKQKLETSKRKTPGYRSSIIQYGRDVITKASNKVGAILFMKFIILETEDEDWTFELFNEGEKLMDKLANANYSYDEQIQKELEDFKNKFKAPVKGIEK